MRNFFSLILVFLLISCSEDTLVANISDRQSREIIIQLSKYGIASTLKHNAEDRTSSYSISVKPEDFGMATQILENYNLPRVQDSSFNDITEQKGFIPQQPEFLYLRLDRVLANEIDNQIYTLPEVISAKSIVRQHYKGIGFKSNLNNNIDNKTNISTVVRVAVDGVDQINLIREQILKIVSVAIPSISNDNVQIQIFPLIAVDSPIKEKQYIFYEFIKPFKFHVRSDEKNTVRNYFIFVITISLVFGVFLGMLIYVFLVKIKNKNNQRKPNNINPSVYIE